MVVRAIVITVRGIARSPRPGALAAHARQKPRQILEAGHVAQNFWRQKAEGLNSVCLGGLATGTAASVRGPLPE
jgi:hypothetical protein